MSQGRITDEQCTRLGELILTALSAEYRYGVSRLADDKEASIESREAQKALWKYIYSTLYYLEG